MPVKIKDLKYFNWIYRKAGSLMTLENAASRGEMEEKANCQSLRGKKFGEMNIVRIIFSLE